MLTAPNENCGATNKPVRADGDRRRWACAFHDWPTRRMLGADVIANIRRPARALDDIAHQANLYHVRRRARGHDRRNSGHAAAVDCLTPYGNDSNSTYNLADEQSPAVVILQSARLAGPVDGLRRFGDGPPLPGSLRDRAGARVGLPYKLGCGIAGGDWTRVREVIDAVFAKSPVEVVICTRPEDVI